MVPVSTGGGVVTAIVAAAVVGPSPVCGVTGRGVVRGLTATVAVVVSRTRMAPITALARGSAIAGPFVAGLLLSPLGSGATRLAIAGQGMLVAHTSTS